MDGAESTLEVLEYVVMKCGVDCGLINENGHSPLHKAAIYGRADVCDFLINRTVCCGREHTSPDKLNQRPSDMALYNGFAELARRLRHHEDIVWLIPTVWNEISAVCRERNRDEGLHSEPLPG